MLEAHQALHPSDKFSGGALGWSSFKQNRRQLHEFVHPVQVKLFQRSWHSRDLDQSVHEGCWPDQHGLLRKRLVCSMSLLIGIIL